MSNSAESFFLDPLPLCIPLVSEFHYKYKHGFATRSLEHFLRLSPLAFIDS
jgi:hypothetical protein